MPKQQVSGGEKAYYAGTIVGMGVGCVFCLSGLVVCILGLNGNIEWVVQAGGFASNLKNAGPGVVFAVVGGLIMWRYRPRYDYYHEKEVIEPKESEPQKSESASPAPVRRTFEREFAVLESKKRHLQPRSRLEDQELADKMRKLLLEKDEDSGRARQPQGAGSNMENSKPREDPEDEK